MHQGAGSTFLQWYSLFCKRKACVQY